MNVDEQQHRAEFKQWYISSGRSANTANTLATAIGRARLKNGRAVFAIADFDELDAAIKSGGLDDYFESSDGDYSQMDLVFDIEPTAQTDDLKSGIKHYRRFLKSKLIIPSNTPPEQIGGFRLDKNIVLCGVPGTGKTYTSVLYAVAIIEEKPLDAIKSEANTPMGYEAVFSRYLKYKEDGLIAFTTFHQSFGYEEFIEGIRPVVSSDEKSESEHDIGYEVRDGIFKAFCDKAGTPIGGRTNVDLGFGRNPRVWKVSLFSNNDSNLKQYCFSHACARLGKYDVDGQITDATDFHVSGGQVVNTFHNKIKVGDIIVSPKSSKEIDGIGVVTGDAVWIADDDRGDIDDYHRSLPVNWLATNISVDVISQNAGKTMVPPAVTSLSITPNDIVDILNRVTPQLFVRNTNIPNRVFIIDEINRGNISKIFGELITLIESSKRIGASEQIKAILPYSGQSFGVPNNVYIIGTMNTADRSIAIIDTALRRRFSFVEMQPDSDLLRDVIVDEINIAELLAIMNRRITVLLDREHTVGHSYFLSLRSDPTIENLARIFENKIIPLMQEYFYDDYEKIQLVLGDNQKPDDSTRFIVKRSDAVKLFGNADIDYPEYYEINTEAFMRIDAYAFL